MEDIVALDVCFDTAGVNENDTFRIPYVTSWMDIEAMLKAQYDCDRIDVFYQDDDNDQVCVSSEDEWFEARSLAKKTCNVLHLNVCRSRHNSIHEPRLLVPEEMGLEGLLMDMHSPGEISTVVRVPTEKLRNMINEEAIFREMRSDLEKCVLNTEETGEVSPNDLTRDAETGTVMPKEKSTPVQSPGPVIEKKEENECQLEKKEPDGPITYMKFVTFMAKWKRDLHQDIVRDVTKKTARHVLKGLDGAVLESIHGTKGIPLISASEKGNTPSALLHPVYAHDGVICDNCNKTIIGARYKCGNCMDYDLCEECEALNGIHDQEHVFIKIRRPCKRAGVRDGVRRPLLKHSIYRPREKQGTKAETLEKPQIQVDDPIQFSFESSRLQEKLARKQEKLKRREEKMREKWRKKEEKMKRRFEGQMDCPLKRERLEGSDLSQQRSSPVTYDFYRVMMGAQFLGDISIPDGTTVQPGTKLLKTWKMKNNGDGPWTESTKLKHLWGNIPAVKTEVDVPHLLPGDEGQITVELIAPDNQGTYQSHWKMTEHGMQFGHRIWCSIEVQPKEILEPSGKDKLKVVEEALNAEQNMEQETDVYAEKPSEIIIRNEEEPDLLRETTTQRQASQKGEATEEMNKKEREEGEEEAEIKETIEETADKLEQDLTTAAAAMAQLQLQEGEEKVEAEPEYEMLTLQAHECHVPLVSQTATPNNTPRVVTPPMSPTPEQEEEDEDSELRPISKSSSVEVVSAQDYAEDIDQVEHLQQYVENHMASLTGLKPEIDLESLDSDSSYELDYESSLSEDDYIIVPLDLPDCFDPNKPLSRSSIQLRDDLGELDSNHNTIFSGQSRDISVDDILTASGSLSTPPLKPTVAISSLSVKSDSVYSQLSSPAEGATGLVAINTDGATVSVRVEMPSFSQDDSSAGSQSQFDEQPGAVSSPESPQGGTAVTNVSAAAAAGASADITAPVENSDLGTSAESGDQQVKKESLKKSSEPLTEEGKMKDIKGEDQTEKKVSLVDPHPQLPNIHFKKSGTNGSGPSSPTDIANHLVNSAVTAASRAAGQAYSTAKAVFYTWQAKTGEWKPSNSNFKPPSSNGKPQDPSCKSSKDESKPPKDERKPPKDELKPAFWMAPKDEWKPPKDQWKPPKDEWKPPKDEWKPPRSEWKPPTAKWTPPKEAAVSTPREPLPMVILMEMGFFNREHNQRLLQKHENNVEAVIQELLQSSDQDWMNKRH